MSYEDYYFSLREYGNYQWCDRYKKEIEEERKIRREQNLAYYKLHKEELRKEIEELFNVEIDRDKDILKKIKRRR